MNVAFLGNHTVGVTALAALCDVANVVAVVAHPEDPEDGVRYASVYDYALQHKLPVQRGRATDTHVQQFLRDAAPALLWVTDYRYLLPESLLTLAPHGAFNMHPSLLPAYRGRASLNWAILRGETEVGLTVHLVDAGMDSGDIVAQERVAVTDADDIGTVLERLLPWYDALPRTVLRHLEQGTLTRHAQDHSRATVFPRRTPADGRIDWTQPALAIRNLVRAVTAPYPGAFTERAGMHATPIMVWRVEVADLPTHAVPGEVVAVHDGVPVVACGQGALHLVHTEGADHPWTPGDRLL